MTFWGIVLAAGAGRRYGSPKYDVDLGGKPLWQWGRDLFEESGADGVVLVGPVPDGVPGGERRRDSVEAGLSAVPDEVPFVMVHDAARPLASPDLVKRLLERIRQGDAEGVIPVVPLASAIKATDDGWMSDTVDRQIIKVSQTPQAFPAKVLRGALAVVEGDLHDCATAVHQAGGRIAAIDGERSNLKITYEDDLAIAEALLK